MSFPDSSPKPVETDGYVQLQVGAGRLAIRLELQPLGADWLLLLTGGRAHVGAAAVSGPGGLHELAVLGQHKEGPLAAECAAVISAATGRACAVVAGIHQDQATAEEIESLVANAKQGCGELAKYMAKKGGDAL